MLSVAGEDRKRSVPNHNCCANVRTSKLCVALEDMAAVCASIAAAAAGESHGMMSIAHDEDLGTACQSFLTPFCACPLKVRGGRLSRFYFLLARVPTCQSSAPPKCAALVPRFARQRPQIRKFEISKIRNFEFSKFRNFEISNS